MDYDTFTLLGLTEGDLVTLESTNLFQRVVLAPFQLFEPHERYQYLLVVFIALLSLILATITL